jgi:hypothetical protein
MPAEAPAPPAPAPDAEAQQRMAELKGEGGAAAQFRAVQHRSNELIDRAFDLLCILPGGGAAVVGQENPLIFRQP